MDPPTTKAYIPGKILETEGGKKKHHLPDFLELKAEQIRCPLELSIS